MRACLPCLVLSCFTVLLGGCAGSPTPRPLGERESIATAGARCQGARCTCRPLDARADEGSEGKIGDGQKRFELRTGRGLAPMAITVEGRGTLVKSVNEPEGACAYIDLPPGQVRVRVHAQAAQPGAGMVPTALLAEFGEQTHDWYDTFHYKCGEPESCTQGEMRDWFGRESARPRGIWDPCGSTRVTHLRWAAEHSPEERLDDVDIDFVLQVYKFAPRFHHGATTCKGLTGGKAAEEEAAGVRDPVDRK